MNVNFIFKKGGKSHFYNGHCALCGPRWSNETVLHTSDIPIGGLCYKCHKIRNHKKWGYEIDEEYWFGALSDEELVSFLGLDVELMIQRTFDQWEQEGKRRKKRKSKKKKKKKIKPKKDNVVSIFAQESASKTP